MAGALQSGEAVTRLGQARWTRVGEWPLRTTPRTPALWEGPWPPLPRPTSGPHLVVASPPLCPVDEAGDLFPQLISGPRWAVSAHGPRRGREQRRLVPPACGLPAGLLSSEGQIQQAGSMGYLRPGRARQGPSGVWTHPRVRGRLCAFRAHDLPRAPTVSRGERQRRVLGAGRSGGRGEEGALELDPGKGGHIWWPCRLQSGAGPGEPAVNMGT